MRAVTFRCPCGTSVPSGISAPVLDDPRAVRRVPRLVVARRCPGCGTESDFAIQDALAPLP